MATVFLVLLAVVVIWALARSTTPGFAAWGAIGAVIIVLGYFAWRVMMETTTPSSTPAAVPQRTPDPFEQSLTALEPSDVLLSNARLENAVETFTGLDGVRRERPDPDSWTLTGEVKNLAAERTVKDVALWVELYSCPTYFTTAAEESTREELSLICTRVGEASLGLYDLEVPPGMTKAFSRPLTFKDQGRADNWRFWVDVTRVTASLRPTGE